MLAGAMGFGLVVAHKNVSPNSVCADAVQKAEPGILWHQSRIASRCRIDRAGRRTPVRMASWQALEYIGACKRIVWLAMQINVEIAGRCNDENSYKWRAPLAWR
jgi:hypothetical protein